MQKLSAKQLKQMMDRPEDIPVINVLPKPSFEQKHIPGSVNVPVESPKFFEQVEKLTDSRDEQVVVYCASTECDASDKAAKILEQAGYEKVYDFAGGLTEWEEADLPLEGSAATA